MADKTAISWCDSTWNPVRGCTKVSAGCKNCYAERFAERWRGVKGHPFEQGFDVRLVPKALDLPLHWRKPRRIFVNSMSDLFHPDVPDHFIANVYSVMETFRNRHTFLVLTKRPERMRKWLTQWKDKIDYMADAPAPEGGLYMQRYGHIWHGVSVENQETADERIPILLDTPAAHRWISAEPLLGPVEFGGYYFSDRVGRYPFPMLAEEHRTKRIDLINWVVTGCESGPGTRPCDLEWIRSIVRQCKAADVPCFVKQIQLKGKCDRNPYRWPEDLRCQEFPEVKP